MPTQNKNEETEIRLETAELRARLSGLEAALKSDKNKWILWDEIHEVVAALNSLGALQGMVDQNGYRYEKYKQQKTIPIWPDDIALRSMKDIAALMPKDMNEYSYPPSPKEGGVNNPGEDGGVYHYQFKVAGDDQIYLQYILFKQDSKLSSARKKRINECKQQNLPPPVDQEGVSIQHKKNIAECLASRMMGAVIGDSSAYTFYATRPLAYDELQPINLATEEGQDIYVGSPFFRGFSDLYKKLYEIAGIEPPKERPRGVGTGRGVYINENVKFSLTKNEGTRLKPIWESMLSQYKTLIRLRDRIEDEPMKLLENKKKFLRLCHHLELWHEGEPIWKLDKISIREIFRRIFSHGLLADDKKSCRFDDFEQVAVACLRHRDLDMHTANVCLVEKTDANGNALFNERGEHLYRLVKIDMGGALRNMEVDQTGNIHPRSTWRNAFPNPFHWGPSNHFAEFPLPMILTKKMAEELVKQANIDLTEVIHRELDEAASRYGAMALVDFANQMSEDNFINRNMILSNKQGVIKKKPVIPQEISNRISALTREKATLLKRTSLSKPVAQRLNKIQSDLDEMKKTVLSFTKEFLTKQDKLRCKGLKRYALEIKLSLCFVFDKYSNTFILDTSNYHLDDIIKELAEEDKRNASSENESYLRSGHFHFRGEVQRTMSLDEQGKLVHADSIIEFDSANHRKLKTLIDERVLAILGPPPKAKKRKLAETEEGRLENVTPPNYINEFSSAASHVVFFSHGVERAHKRQRLSYNVVEQDSTKAFHFSNWSQLYENKGNFKDSLRDALAGRMGSPLRRNIVPKVRVVDSSNVTDALSAYRTQFRLNEVTVQEKKIHWVEHVDYEKKQIYSDVVGDSDLLDPALIIAKGLQKFGNFNVTKIKTKLEVFLQKNAPESRITQEIIKKFVEKEFNASEHSDRVATELFSHYQRSTQVMVPYEGNLYQLPSADLISIAIRQLYGFISARGGNATGEFSMTIVKEPDYLWAMELIVAARNKYVDDEHKLNFENNTPNCQYIPKPNDAQIAAFFQLLATPEFQNKVSDLLDVNEFLKVPVIKPPNLSSGL